MFIVLRGTTFICTSYNTSSRSVSAVVDSSEVLLQVTPVKVMSNSGRQITTYGPLDSGSDIAMVESSPVKLLHIEGTPSKLSLTTVNSVEETNIKIFASLDSQNDHVVVVDSAWAVKDLTVSLKHTHLLSSVAQWSHLQVVCFSEVKRKKISLLLGTNIQEAFLPHDVRKGKRHVLVGAYSVAPQMYSPTARQRVTCR